MGWPLALRQLAIGNEVCGIDNFSRRKNVEEVGSWSALPILPMKKRLENLKKEYGDKITEKKDAIVQVIKWKLESS